MKQKKYLLIIVIILLIIGVIYGITKIANKAENKTISAYDDIFETQERVDIEISNYIKDKKYTMDSPRIMLNPYEIAPLAALVIFQTPEEVEIEVKVNNVSMTKVQSSKEHAIPIYGMYADYENEVELIASNGNSKKIIIKTDKYDGDPITVHNTCKQVENNLYFISPNFVNNCIIDGKGNVLWYIKRRLCR